MGDRCPTCGAPVTTELCSEDICCMGVGQHEHQHYAWELIQRTIDWFNNDSAYYADRVIGGSGLRIQDAYDRKNRLVDDLKATFDAHIRETTNRT